MASSLNIVPVLKDRILGLKLIGSLDENADYSTVKFDGVARVLVDFDQVTRINSIGIQKWIQFFKTVPAEADIFFYKCSPVVVKQLNLFPAFTAQRHVEILSFYAPYFCPACKISSNLILQKTDCEITSGNIRAPQKTCAKCQGVLEFDAVEKKYLIFLIRR